MQKTQHRKRFSLVLADFNLVVHEAALNWPLGPSWELQVQSTKARKSFCTSFALKKNREAKWLLAKNVAALLCKSFWKCHQRQKSSSTCSPSYNHRGLSKWSAARAFFAFLAWKSCHQHLRGDAEIVGSNKFMYWWICWYLFAYVATFSRTARDEIE